MIYNVPINLDIEIEAEDAEQAWQQVYQLFNDKILELVTEQQLEFVLEVAEPVEVGEAGPWL